MRTSILSAVLAPTPGAIFRAQLAHLRRVEAEHAYLPRFDEKTLPAKRQGQSEVDWRHAQLDVLQTWVRRAQAVVADVAARSKLSTGGVA